MDNTARLRTVTVDDSLALALELWPDARDYGQVKDASALDGLLESLGQPGAIGFDCGLRNTFTCFAPDETAVITLPSGEKTMSDSEARFIGHVLVTRTLLAAGLHVDQRVISAMAASYAFSWTALGGRYGQTPLALATSLWLIALDPLSNSDRPIAIEWDAECFDDPQRWDLQYRLFSHYDIRGRAIDWVVYVASAVERREGCSIYTIVEPLLRMGGDNQVGLALSSYSQSEDATLAAVNAAAMLDRGRVATLLKSYLGSKSPD